MTLTLIIHHRFIDLNNSAWPSKLISTKIRNRARDTEYMVLSALGMLLKQKPAWADKPMSITMYSKLPMCPACHSAASHAILSEEFAQLKSLTVFSNH